MKAIHKLFLIGGTALILPYIASANAPAKWTAGDTHRAFLLGFAVLLMLIIAVLSKTIFASIQIKKERMEKEKKKKNIASSVLLIGALLLNNSLWATTEIAEKKPSLIHNWEADIIILTLIIILEVIIVFVLIKIQLDILKKTPEPKLVKSQPNKWSTLFQKLNNTVAIENEDQLDLKHDYDGIRELDNNIPKWWQLAFVSTVIFGVIYLFRMFVTETIPTQESELHESNRIAALEKAEYLKNAANNVDENTVVMLDEDGIELGKILFKEKGCNTCHGDIGEGNSVGPNLTDDHWLHKGSIKDVFYSIKYGWPEKGMISWESQLSPVQIAQIASYIKSLKGTNPPSAKAPQGEPFIENDTTPLENADTAAATTTASL